MKLVLIFRMKYPDEEKLDRLGEIMDFVESEMREIQDRMDHPVTLEENSLGSGVLYHDFKHGVNYEYFGTKTDPTDGLKGEFAVLKNVLSHEDSPAGTLTYQHLEKFRQMITLQKDVQVAGILYKKGETLPRYIEVKIPWQSDQK